MGMLIQKQNKTDNSILIIKKSEGEKAPTRHYSDKQEKAVAKAVNGRQTSNSGATMFGGKSDVSIDNLFSLECKTKTTHSNSISIKKEWFEKLQKEALFDGHAYNALAFNFGPDERNYYVIDEYLFTELVNYLKIKHNL